MKPLVIYSRWQVEIFYSIGIFCLLIARAVVIILRNKADFFGLKLFRKIFDQISFTRAASSGNANGVRRKHKVWFGIKNTKYACANLSAL
jgi:hypothetical protein